MTFDPNFAQQFVNDSDPFSVSLDKACDCLGLTDKHTALDMVQSYFEEFTDYVWAHDTCWLTVNCLGELALIANTPEGKAARRYYLERDRPQQEQVRPETVPIVAPAEKPLPIMRTRKMQRLEMEALPALAKKIPKFRRAVDIARERAAKATEEATIDW